MKRILILGGTRFIGKHLLYQLDTMDYEIFYFHRGFTKLERHVTATEILGNRTCEQDLQRLFSLDYDIVIDVSGEDYTMVELSSKYAGPKQPYYIYISSSSVYKASTKPHKETDSLNIDSESSYTQQKIQSESLVQKCFHKYAIVRPSKIYGPYNHIYRENFFIDRIKAGKKIHIVNNPVLHFTYVLDLISAILILIERQPIGIFNVAGKEPATVTTFIHTISNLLAIPANIIYSDTSDSPFSYLPNCVLDCTKIKDLCNWMPTYHLENGLSETIFFKEEDSCGNK